MAVRPPRGPAPDLRRALTGLFDLQDVRLSRGGQPVLAGVTAAIGRGSTALLGPSGSGKSSLLRLLNRLADPDAGRVLLHGEDLRALDVLALRRRVVSVPQLPAPLAATVADDVRFGPRLAGTPDERVDVGRLLTVVGLDPGFAERPTARLSVGEQQRVMLARALALEPEVLLLDEPTSALDEAARDAVEATILRLRDEEGLSLVVVTHDRAQAARLAERTIRLEDGRVAG